MSSAYEDLIMASVALEFVPPLIRESMLKNPKFKEVYGIDTEAKIVLESVGASFQRSILFDAVRTILDQETLVKVIDIEDISWTITSEKSEKKFPRLTLSSDEKRYLLPDFTMLSSSASQRVLWLREKAADLNLDANTQEKWIEVLNERALLDDEVDLLYRDINDTPVHVERTILSEINTGNVSIPSLVPNSRSYFERLVGVYDGSTSITDYACSVAREFIKEMFSWRPYEGLLYGLLLSSHSDLTREINIDSLSQSELEKAFGYLGQYGDILSLLGAVEVGVRAIEKMPGLEPFVLQLVDRIRGNSGQESQIDFELFTALFILVDGELARTRLLADRPPFYRRLASLAQAGLIQRQFLKSGIEYGDFPEWAVNNRSEYFYMQSLSDMRSEPRWDPELVVESQMRADFFGRIIIVGSDFKESLGNSDLYKAILSQDERSIINLCEFPRPYFPGPLEGSRYTQNKLPNELKLIIEEELNKDDVGASSFVALVNSAMIFNISSGQAELATKALRLVNYTLANLKDRFQLLGILNGLAKVAAVSQNPALAEELRILVRRYRNDPQFSITIEEAMKVCLIASSAWEELEKWQKFAGEWLTELAMGELKGDEAEVLHSHLLVLMNSVPELWLSCAKADAALMAWCSR